jgi:hypothetical protein
MCSAGRPARYWWYPRRARHSRGPGRPGWPAPRPARAPRGRARRRRRQPRGPPARAPSGDGPPAAAPRDWGPPRRCRPRSAGPGDPRESRCWPPARAPGAARARTPTAHGVRRQPGAPSSATATRSAGPHQVTSTITRPPRPLAVCRIALVTSSTATTTTSSRSGVPGSSPVSQRRTSRTWSSRPGKTRRQRGRGSRTRGPVPRSLPRLVPGDVIAAPAVMNRSDRQAAIASRALAYLAEIPRLKQADQPQQNSTKASTRHVAYGGTRGLECALNGPAAPGSRQSERDRPVPGNKALR